MELNNLIAVRKDKTVYRDGDKTIKLFDENYSKSNILNEAINQARVEETGLNIPKIREITVLNGKWAIVMDYIEGDTLETLMEQHPEKKDEYLDLFIKIQMEIHSKKHLLLTKFNDKMILKILASDLDASTRYDLSMRIGKQSGHTSICHGDFNPSNVVISKSGTPYILDWSHASQGNALADVAKSYLIFKMEGKDGLADEYLTRYTEITGDKKEQIKKWVPLVAAAQLVKVNEEKKKLLLKYINGEID